MLCLVVEVPMSLKQIHPSPPLTRYLVQNRKAFPESPLRVLDIGARHGCEPFWQVYEDQLVLLGIEPDPQESAQLNQKAASNIRYFPVVLEQKRQQRIFHLAAWPGASGFYPGNQAFLQRFPEEYGEAMQIIDSWQVETLPLDEWKANQDPSAYDFIKLDAEGSELDILRGAQQTLTSTLGLSLEVLFQTQVRHQPSFSEIDLFLTEKGFRLFDLALYRHARRAFPLPPLEEGNTLLGQVLWGQALYLRDGVEELEQAESNWDETRLHKLASLMEVFCLPDCATELLLKGIACGILPESDHDLLDCIRRDPWIWQVSSALPQTSARMS